MAIDTAEKRASVHAYSGNDSALVGRLDLAGLLNAADRSHITDRYRGVAAAAPGGSTFMAMQRALFRLVFSRLWGRVN